MAKRLRRSKKNHSKSTSRPLSKKVRSLTKRLPLRTRSETKHTSSDSNEIIEPKTGSSVFVEPKPKRPQAKKLPKKPTPLERFDQRPKEDHHKIIATLIVLNVLIFSAIAVLLLPKTAHANYSDAYQLARDLKKEVQSIKNDTSCTKVIDYANKSFVTADTYETYIKDCQTISDAPEKYINKLPQTEALKTDDNLAKLFKSFTDAYDDAARGSKSLALALDQYRIWHQWVISSSANTSELSWTDAELDSTAKILTDSDISAFAKYGKDWRKYFGDFVSASREYYTASFSDEHKEELRTKMTDTKKAYEDWQASATPDLKKLLPLENPNLVTLSAKYDNFYSALRTAYQENYDPSAGGCRELADKILCD